MILSKNIKFAYKKENLVIKNVSFELGKGKIIGVIGPNGCGKSTLLKLLSGYLDKDSGEIYINGTDLNTMERKERAKIIGVVPQKLEVGFPFIVRDFVLMGRYPFLKRLEGYSKNDKDAVEKIIEEMKIGYLANKSIESLSGGEKQLVFIAKALVSNPEILLLDEPISNLDINHQKELREIVKKLNAQNGTTVVIVSHDINYILGICEEIIVLKNGEIYKKGKVRDVITVECIEKVFGVTSEIILYNNSDIYIKY